MERYNCPESDLTLAVGRTYVAAKAGGIVPPPVIDIHPNSGHCNNDCRWCIGRKDRMSLDPLPPILNKETIITALQMILAPRWKPLWPGEFHIAGCDSEPLLSDAVVPAVHFLIQRNRIVEVVTNGNLEMDEGMIDALARVSYANFSIDVTSDEEYIEHKVPKGTPAVEPPLTRVLNNIHRVSQRRAQIGSTVSLSASFVATPKTYDAGKWQKFFGILQQAGVSRIRVRDDLNNTYGEPIPSLADDMKKINETLVETGVSYISPSETYSEFDYCRGCRLWPALAADGCLYPCAHVATTKYEPFADLLAGESVMSIYQELFLPPGDSFQKVADIGCERKGPSFLGSFNEPRLARERLLNSLGVNCL